MAYNYPYLKDPSFLKKFDEIKLKEQYVKIVTLSFDEKPIQEIQGRVVSGNFSLDGSSGMRRTANISLIVDDQDGNVTNIKNLLSINKKVEILIGFLNTTDQYPNYSMIWFPQGVFVIISPNVSHTQDGINISLTLHDKMALLNGQCGGTIPASVVFHEVEFINEDGEIEISQPTIYQIIVQLLNHFGGEQIGKIIIGDIDNKIKKVMQWTGATPLYLFQTLEDDGSYTNHFTTKFQQIENPSEGKFMEFTYGDNVGFILSDFYFPGELVANAGDTVVTILDKIKDLFGNYEYFYDIDGNFRFQEIKNYLNSSYSTFLLNQMDLNNYLTDYASGKSVYTFEDAKIIQSFSSSPQYQQIKNDFLVWGKRKSINGNEIPIRYHLAIDSKPQIGNTYDVFFYVDPDDEITKAKVPQKFSKYEDFPTIGKPGQHYYAGDTEQIYEWSMQNKKYELTSYTLTSVTSTDFRTELYLSGINSEPFGLESNYYFTELKNEWPKIYDIQNQQFFKETLTQSSDIDFFLDFIDTSSAISEFSVQNIGRRTAVLVDDSINCIFEPSSPDLILLESGSDDLNDQREECRKRKQEWVQVDSTIYSMLSNGGSLRSAYDEIKKQLYQYTSYNQQVSLTTIPIYYLEPNTRITIRDAASGIFGDYIIKTISLPLDINGTMSLSCTKALERN